MPASQAHHFLCLRAHLHCGGVLVSHIPTPWRLLDSTASITFYFLLHGNINKTEVVTNHPDTWICWLTKTNYKKSETKINNSYMHFSNEKSFYIQYWSFILHWPVLSEVYFSNSIVCQTIKSFFLVMYNYSFKLVFSLHQCLGNKFKTNMRYLNSNFLFFPLIFPAVCPIVWFVLRAKKEIKQL